MDLRCISNDGGKVHKYDWDEMLRDGSAVSQCASMISGFDDHLIIIPAAEAGNYPLCKRCFPRKESK